IIAFREVHGVQLTGNLRSNGHGREWLGGTDDADLEGYRLADHGRDGHRHGAGTGASPATAGTRGRCGVFAGASANHERERGGQGDEDEGVDTAHVFRGSTESYESY